MYFTLDIVKFWECSFLLTHFFKLIMVFYLLNFLNLLWSHFRERKCSFLFTQFFKLFMISFYPTESVDFCLRQFISSQFMTRFPNLLFFRHKIIDSVWGSLFLLILLVSNIKSWFCLRQFISSQIMTHFVFSTSRILIQSCFKAIKSV